MTTHTPTTRRSRWTMTLAALAAAAAPLAAHADSASLMALAQKNDASRYNSIVAKGAEIRATTDNLAFSIWWQPSGWKSNSGVIVALHGHDAYASSEAYLWQPYAQKYGYAVLTLQWWFGAGEDTSDYYRPDQMYPLIAAYLSDKGVKPGTVMFTGFSRGSANSYATAVLDNQPSSRKYFAWVLSNSGGAATNYPPNQTISAGTFGSKPFTGMKWGYYCGEKDDDPNQSGCPAMRSSRDWVQQLGGSTVLFIDDAVGDHGGFMTNSTNVETALATYAGLLGAANAAPACTLSASSSPAKLGTPVTITASCSPTATSYTWTGGTCAGTSGASCSTSPTARTTYTVTGSNANGTGSAASLTLDVVDGTAPTAPGSLKALVQDAASVKLTWTGSVDNVGVTGYRVYRDGVLVASPTSAGYTDTGLKSATSYSYTVAGCDAAGNCSSQSAAATATTQALGNVLSASELECLLNWAEDSYTAELQPRRATTQSSAPYSYRYYASTKAYVGVSSVDNHVYFVDARGAFTDLGLAATWSTKAGCR